MVNLALIINIISNIIELSKKAEEHNGEFKELQKNFQMFLNFLHTLESTDILPDFLWENMIKDLDEAQKLLESGEINNWFEKISIGVMPGNKTRQLKEKNKKIFNNMMMLTAKITENNIQHSKKNDEPLLKRKAEVSLDPPLEKRVRFFN